MMQTPQLVWFRDDLRVTDNAALHAAAQRGPVVGVVVEETVDRPLGAAAQWWRAASITRLSQHVPLIRAKGDPREIVPRIASELGAEVRWNRRYHLTDIDATVKEATGATSYPGFLLAEPWDIATRTGTAFQVFTPFSKALAAHLADTAPAPLAAPAITPADVDVAQLSDAPAYAAPAWAQDTLAQHCTPGEGAALERFHAFLDSLAGGEAYDNNDLTSQATSGLSPHLRFGELSPGYVWAETLELADAHPETSPHVWAFLRQLAWRDFAWHRFYQHPDMATRNVRNQFDRFDWAWTPHAVPGSDPHAFAHPAMDAGAEHLEQLAAWQRGATGVPLVDAGMKELWATGTMHNRVRMVAGSWLTKNLGIHWRHGEEWFWDTLVDADMASNPFNWQWVAGSGDDAAPYFRVFNPLTQQEKFDPQGAYVARWVPEALTPMYPEPMVDVKASRRRALDAYEEIRHGNGA